MGRNIADLIIGYKVHLRMQEIAKIAEIAKEIEVERVRTLGGS